MNYVKHELPLDADFPYRIFQSNARQMYLHSHDFLEMNYVLSGSGYYLIGEREYEIQPGDFYIINNRDHHMAVHDGGLTLEVVIFEPAFWGEGKQSYRLLEPFFNTGARFHNCIRPHQEGYGFLKETFKHICQEYTEQRPGWELYVKAWTQLFMAELYRFYCNCRETNGQSKHRPFTHLQPVLDYIHDHYTEQLSLDTLAKVALLNKSYLCDCFKKTLHMRIFEYIDQLRINRACLLLSITDESVTNIAAESGFNSVSYFNRIFKKVCGISPGVWRKTQI